MARTNDSTKHTRLIALSLQVVTARDCRTRERTSRRSGCFQLLASAVASKSTRTPIGLNGSRYPGVPFSTSISKMLAPATNPPRAETDSSAERLVVSVLGHGNFVAIESIARTWSSTANQPFSRAVSGDGRSGQRKCGRYTSRRWVLPCPHSGKSTATDRPRCPANQRDEPTSRSRRALEVRFVAGGDDLPMRVRIALFYARARVEYFDRHPSGRLRHPTHECLGRRFGTRHRYDTMQVHSYASRLISVSGTTFSVPFSADIGRTSTAPRNTSASVEPESSTQTPNSVPRSVTVAVGVRTANN